MELIPEDGYDGLHQGDCGCQSREEYQQEEDRADRPSKFHAGKYFRQRNEHQSRTCAERGTVAAGEREYGRNDHKACKESDAGIKHFNLANRTFQIIILLHIRAIGNHDSHCQRHGVEELSHSGKDRLG